MVLSSGTLEKSLAVIYLMLHALIEILGKWGLLVPCKVIPLMTRAKWVPIVCACVWSVFLDDLKGVKGMTGFYAMIHESSTGDVQKSSLVGARMLIIALMLKSAPPVFSIKTSLCQIFNIWLFYYIHNLWLFKNPLMCYKCFPFKLLRDINYYWHKELKA